MTGNDLNQVELRAEGAMYALARLLEAIDERRGVPQDVLDERAQLEAAGSSALRLYDWATAEHAAHIARLE